MIGRVIRLLLVIAAIGGFILWGSFVSYEYDKAVGSHINNAYEMNTPERMITELKEAKAGMVELGLTEDMSSALIFKKSDNSMKFQYEFIDSIISRAESVRAWYNKTYSENGTSESLGDVYEQKMDNIREFIMENGRSDWIANDAWMLNKNILFWGIVPWAIIGILLLLGACCVVWG